MRIALLTYSTRPRGGVVHTLALAAAAGPAGVAGRQAWRERLGRYVLAVGGIEPRKGTLDLVEAMATVQARRPELSLVVAGGETLFDYRDYRARVEARAAELGVVPVVLGPVDHDQLPALMAAADAFAGDPAGFAAALLAAGDDPRRRATGQALADRHSWDGAAAAHLSLYAALTGSAALT
ncbi:MAG: hypothetical protein JWR70_2200 [Modestobacter sp.]|jgi:hypothetical protein|nr:hypothetical protein [Modestobacter sp.]